MALWQAQIRVVPSGILTTVQVEAGTVGTAKQTIDQIYNPVQILNLRQVSNSLFQPNYSTGGGALLFGILVIGGLFLYLTPYVLSVLYGGAATWISQKVVGQTMEEYNDKDDDNPEDHKKASIVFWSALLFGMLGFVHGTVWHQDLKKQYIDNKTKSEIHRVVNVT